MSPAMDLRSGTVTRPTAAVREAGLCADVGEDPIVNALQAWLAGDSGF